MIHARSDYNRIQDPAGLIGDDEPVFLLRAKDLFAPDTLRFWARMVQESNTDGSHELALSVNNFADFMNEWQKKNGFKIPDTPNDIQWK